MPQPWRLPMRVVKPKRGSTRPPAVKSRPVHHCARGPLSSRGLPRHCPAMSARSRCRWALATAKPSASRGQPRYDRHDHRHCEPPHCRPIPPRPQPPARERKHHFSSRHFLHDACATRPPDGHSKQNHSPTAWCGGAVKWFSPGPVSNQNPWPDASNPKQTGQPQVLLWLTTEQVLVGVGEGDAVGHDGPAPLCAP